MTTFRVISIDLKTGDGSTEKIRQRIAAGERQCDIARDFGIGPTGINDIRAGRNWKHVPGALPPVGPMSGRRHGQARLSESRVREIRSAFAAGESVSGIAGRLNEVWQRVYDVAHRRTWRSLV